jgi:hypothetical protein
VHAVRSCLVQQFIYWHVSATIHTPLYTHHHHHHRCLLTIPTVLTILTVPTILTIPTIKVLACPKLSRSGLLQLAPACSSLRVLHSDCIALQTKTAGKALQCVASLLDQGLPLQSTLLAADLSTTAASFARSRTDVASHVTRYVL